MVHDLENYQDLVKGAHTSAKLLVWSSDVRRLSGVGLCC